MENVSLSSLSLRVLPLLFISRQERGLLVWETGDAVEERREERETEG